MHESSTATVVRIAAAVLTLAGVLALISGLLFWAGTALNLIAMHMLLGFLTVGALWVVAAAQATSRGGSWTLASIAAAVGAATIVVGLRQTTWMAGDLHWMIRVIHLLLGVMTIGVGHMAAARYRKNSS